MTELAISWIRGIWGREVLRRKVEQLEERYNRIRKFTDTLIETNRRQGQQLVEIEEDNKRLTAALEAWEAANRRIDPNAKCPVCGATNGFLAHIPKFDPSTRACVDVICQNNCKECGAKFISAEPVAGRQLAAKLYQPDLTNVPRIIPPTDVTT